MGDVVHAALVLRHAGHGAHGGLHVRGTFSVFQVTADGLRSVIAVNAPRDIKAAKRWLKQGTCPLPSVLVDVSVRLDKL
ncbi:MAG: oxidoreductase C-terminal domain-containing protein [Burkholderiaceae bacterium]